MINYYDGPLGYWVTPGGPQGREFAAATLPALAKVNAQLVGDFGSGYVHANVAKAFDTYDMTTIGGFPKTTPYYGLPKDVAVVCADTINACGLGHKKRNGHPNHVGHKLIADTLFAALQQHWSKAGG